MIENGLVLENADLDLRPALLQKNTRSHPPGQCDKVKGSSTSALIAIGTI